MSKVTDRWKQVFDGHTLNSATAATLALAEQVERIADAMEPIHAATTNTGGNPLLGVEFADASPALRSEIYKHADRWEAQIRRERAEGPPGTGDGLSQEPPNGDKP